MSLLTQIFSEYIEVANKFAEAMHSTMQKDNEILELRKQIETLKQANEIEKKTNTHLGQTRDYILNQISGINKMLDSDTDAGPNGIQKSPIHQKCPWHV